MKRPPEEATHLEISNGSHTVWVVPLKWKTFKGKTWVTEACAHCKTCGWDTPILFSLSATESAARRHLDLLVLNNTKPGVEECEIAK